jgi:hypothetical protein
MTEDGILFDLLLRRYHHHAVRVAHDPREQAEDDARDPETQQAMIALKQRMSTPEFLESVKRGVEKHRDGDRPRAGKPLKQITLARKDNPDG